MIHCDTSVWKEVITLPPTLAAVDLEITVCSSLSRCIWFCQTLYQEKTFSCNYMAKLAVKISFNWFGISCSFEFEFSSDLPQFDSSFLADCVKDYAYVLHSPKSQSYSKWKKTSKNKNRNNSIVERAFSYPFFKMYKLLLWWMQHTRLEYIFFFRNYSFTFQNNKLHLPFTPQGGLKPTCQLLPPL